MQSQPRSTVKTIPWPAMLYASQYRDLQTLDLAAPHTLAARGSEVDALDDRTARAWVSAGVLNQMPPLRYTFASTNIASSTSASSMEYSPNRRCTSTRNAGRMTAEDGMVLEKTQSGIFWEGRSTTSFPKSRWRDQGRCFTCRIGWTTLLSIQITTTQSAGPAMGERRHGNIVLSISLLEQRS